MRFLFLSALLVPTVAFAQTASDTIHEELIDTTAIRYLERTADDYPGFEHAHFILDYFYTDGVSLGDRYSYEIVVIDSVVMTAFSSRGSDDYRAVADEGKRVLSAKALARLLQVVDAAGLYQRKAGVPQPTASAHTQEVLVLRSPGRKICGGMFNLVLFDERDLDRIATEIAHERRLTSSVGGNYDAVFTAMKALYPQLPRLLKQVQVE